MIIAHGLPARRTAPYAPPYLLRCANLFARPTTPFQPGWPEMVSVWLDAQNHIMRVSEAWDSFVDRAAMEDLHGDTILGRPLSHFISDLTMRHAFHALLHNVRQTGQAAHINARCDAPGGPARALWLDFSPDAEDGVQATWRFAHGDAAELVPLRRRMRFMPDELIRACGWCWRFRLGAGWQRIDHVAVELGLLDRTPLPLVTHGICPRCSTALRADCLHAFAESH